MIRGTTPAISFHIVSDIDFSLIDDVWITLGTWKKKITWKYSENEVAIDPDNKYITVQLSQEDTLEYDAGKVEIQMRLLDTNGLAYATRIFETDMNRILEGGVIGGNA